MSKKREGNTISECGRLNMQLSHHWCLSTTGGMGSAATTFYKRLASMIAEKREASYAVTLNWIRCRLSFAQFRAYIMYNRGARSSRNHPANEYQIDLLLAEGHLIN